MGRLFQKVAMVTGGSGGIGAATVRHLSREGAKVVIADLHRESGEALAQDINNKGGDAYFVQLNVTREDEWVAAIDTVVGRYGGLDVLVNNAGIYLGKAFEETSLSDWNTICAVNLTGVILGTKHSLDALRQRAKSTAQGSSIINMSSIAGIRGSSVDPLYSLTKGGITTFTKSMAIEFGRKGYRIRVNSVHPHSVQTEMTTRHLSGDNSEAAANDAYRSAAMLLPIQRMAIPEDIAAAVAFLASDESGFMTGSSVVIDGGASA